ncbi:uncharacterized protein PHACADRAFT_133615 [Phanerochaete carnosa HHB-10118-sp]|uniref:Non-haem dioxygenase N-terminal domain-containing protein n=1 Tax=Phanerochaete carnosa (strain HHB-10118-sp) TaxID=650164 RepID=K5WNQ7_PHACS|nr:uncharacterized protein PHACADRAFT_133615 [Phanerochaete carnosa HHB-10118-sp]EKM60814.1 hypothetical protein PHACADRAFT_133615 [Phanerochaete carnosa HHB-10118-sp]
MTVGSVLRRSLATVASGTRAVRQRPVEYTSEGAVSISYEALQSEPLSLAPSIEKAFGHQPDSLGIIVVRDLPEHYFGARERLLKLAYAFASLNEPTRERYADPKSRYSFGWSHGKEIMNGKPDVLKGSYYANPVMDEPDISKELRDAYPEYYGKNIWPKDVEAVQNFETSFKSLGRLVFDIGCDLAAACQPFGTT